MFVQSANLANLQIGQARSADLQIALHNLQIIQESV